MIADLTKNTALKATAFLTSAAIFSHFLILPAISQEVGFQQSPAAQTPPSQTKTQAADPNASPGKGYSKYYQAPGVWNENEDIPPPGIDAPPTAVPPAPGDPGSDAATPVGNESMAPTQGTPDPDIDPNADNGGMNSAAAEPAAASGVGSDHPGMNGP